MGPTRYKWSSNPYKWGYFTLLIGIITPFITGRGPPNGLSPYSQLVRGAHSVDRWSLGASNLTSKWGKEIPLMFQKSQGQPLGWCRKTLSIMGYLHIFTISTGERRISEPSLQYLAIETGPQRGEGKWCHLSVEYMSGGWLLIPIVIDSLWFWNKKKTHQMSQPIEKWY